MAQLFDAYGQLVEVSALKEVRAAPTLTGVRSIRSTHPSRGLTPAGIMRILGDAEDADPESYLALAEDMEEKDLHYLSVLNTRKHSVAGLEYIVEPASESADDKKAADLVRDVFGREDLADDVFDILDAIGKGFSVTEIIWDTDTKPWRPIKFAWRDPRWFRFDRVDGETLWKLGTGGQLEPLEAYKYIRHISRAKSGLPIRGGLARVVSWTWLFKNFAEKDWLAFCEVYGIPWRLGKYQPGATESDKRALLRAVNNIGSDAAAIVPSSMVIDLLEASKGSASDFHERLCDWLDRQVSKGVLGQTLTTEAGKTGTQALGTVHNDVRKDIQASDTRRLNATINRDVVRPIVDLNLGQRAKYPCIRFFLPDELSRKEKLDVVFKGVELGLKVSQEEVRRLGGIRAPANEDELMVPRTKPAPTPPTDPVDDPKETAEARARIARASAQPGNAATGDELDELRRAAITESGWEPITDVESLIDSLFPEHVTMSLKEMRAALDAAIKSDALNLDQLGTVLERALIMARVAGEVGAELTTSTPDGGSSG